MSTAVAGAVQALPKIEIRHLTVDYAEKNRRFTALKDVSFTVNDGEFVSIIGSSGCGKSTLLSVLEGLYRQADGEITISGKPLSGTGTERGVVFQHYSLFPWMTTRKSRRMTHRACGAPRWTGCSTRRQSPAMASRSDQAWRSLHTGGSALCFRGERD